MSETESVPVVPAPVAPPPAARPRSGAGNLAVLLAVVAIAGAGYSTWRVAEFERSVGTRADALRERQDELIRQTDKLMRETDRLRGDLEANTRRFADVEAVNKSLREELLGVGERAALLEDAMASLAERRLDGATALRLNEAEFLLRLGAERLRLFGDITASLTAFRLADEQLAGLDDALFAGVRQTLATEIEMLGKLAAVDVPGTMARIDALAAAVDELPTRAEPKADAQVVTEPGFFDRAFDTLTGLVRVRRLDAADGRLLDPLNARLLRADIALELSLAKAALAARDATRYRDALTRARVRLGDGFAGGDRAAELAAELDTLAALPVRPAPVAIGRALEELGNLRATRALADERPRTAPVREPQVPAAPTPAETPAETPAVSPAETPTPEAP